MIPLESSESHFIDWAPRMFKHLVYENCFSTVFESNGDKHINNKV